MSYSRNTAANWFRTSFRDSLGNFWRCSYSSFSKDFIINPKIPKNSIRESFKNSGKGFSKKKSKILSWSMPRNAKLSEALVKLKFTNKKKSVEFSLEIHKEFFLEIYPGFFEGCHWKTFHGFIFRFSRIIRKYLKTEML